MKPRILLAGLFHETHTFLDETTSPQDFSILRGNELLTAATMGSPLASAVEAGQRLGWEFVPAIDYRAQPSGTVQDEVFEQYWREFVAHSRNALAAGIDAIYFVLHGAMVTQTCTDVEGELLARLRALPGARDVPVFGVFDLHANFSQRMAEHVDCLVAYRENPHSDACAMASYAAELLQAALATNRRPRTYWQSAGIVWPPSGTGTADSPMRELEALARQYEQQPGILAVNICGGFAFADTPDTGVSFTVVTPGPEHQTREMLDELCSRAWELREAGVVVDPPVSEVMSRLPGLAGLTVIAEPSDNIGGGAPGDGTGLLRAMVEHRIARAAICICDPEAVQRLHSVEIGAAVTLPIGGKGSLDEGPLVLEVELVSRRDGLFALEDPQSHLASMFGNRFDMGPCAVVRHAGVTLLLTSRKTPPFDLGQWRSQGIEPTDYAVIGVKAAVAHRRVYAPIAARMWSVDTPGPCRTDLSTLPYQHIRRPIYPLDSDKHAG